MMHSKVILLATLALTPLPLLISGHEPVSDTVPTGTEVTIMVTGGWPVPVAKGTELLLISPSGDKDHTDLYPIRITGYEYTKDLKRVYHGIAFKPRTVERGNPLETAIAQAPENIVVADSIERGCIHAARIR